MYLNYGMKVKSEWEVRLPPSKILSFYGMLEIAFEQSKCGNNLVRRKKYKRSRREHIVIFICGLIYVLYHLKAFKSIKYALAPGLVGIFLSFFKNIEKIMLMYRKENFLDNFAREKTF